MNRMEYKEALLNSGIRKHIAAYAEGVSPLLTLEEVEAQFKSGVPCDLNIISVLVSGRIGVEFFTRDYCFGTHVLPGNFCHCSYQIPFKVLARKGIDDGVVDTFGKYKVLHRWGCESNESTRHIFDFEELLDYLEETGIIQ